MELQNYKKAIVLAKTYDFLLQALYYLRLAKQHQEHGQFKDSLIKQEEELQEFIDEIEIELKAL